MRYTTEVIIEKPLEEVVSLYQDTDNMKKWQPELVDYKIESGRPGEEGSVAILRYKMGKREVDMKETITLKNPPHEYNAVYEAKNVYNLMQNRFEKVGMDSTRWIAISDFKFKGLMAIVAPIIKSVFKKQTAKSLHQFKRFVENLDYTDPEQVCND
ncbi:MAG: SRPBCC family protein [Bacteroidales bacterium]|nr:SRPBCC family protein [Bacteroidales bacterium]MCF8344745.1 SRPBCC family protein [Bacteroidales bacterium]MCF8352102.1 SRPBCC family protein [Bacteroidales bacterium]MCF8377310.1 SRPBCC family protein [Bacteroidales bacterium]